MKTILTMVDERQTAAPLGPPSKRLKIASTTNLLWDQPAPKPVEHPVLEEHDLTSEAEGKERGDTKGGLEDATPLDPPSSKRLKIATDLADGIESNTQSGSRPLSVDASGTEPDMKKSLEVCLRPRVC